MNTKLLKKAVFSVTKALASDLPIAACFPDSQVPTYENNPCTLCTLHKQESSIRRLCNQFYREFTNSESTRTCPLGVSVAASPVKTPQLGTVLILSHTGVNVSIAEAAADGLPRIAKKKLQDAAKQMRSTPLLYPNCHDAVLNIIEIIQAITMHDVFISVGALGHDLLTPVQGAMADAQNIRVFAEAHDYPEMKSNASRLIYALQETSRVVKQMGVLLSGGLEYSMNSLRKVTVHNLVKDVARRLESIADEKHLRIKIGFNNSSIHVHAVPDQLEIVIYNIIENAVKYSHRGKPDALREVRVSFDSHDGFLFISVSNFGVRIDQDEIDNGSLFELHYRGRHSRDRGRKGTGIGLYIARRIAVAHRGDLIVQCRDSRGGDSDGTLTEVFIKWPILLKE